MPRALLVPHLDPRRAGAAIARAMLELPAEPKEPLRIVVFGTGHSLFGDLFALTRKHFETPLGKVTCDTVFVDRVADRLGDLAYSGELAHREEHSIEFEAVYLNYRFGDRPVTIVPILCGGFHSLIDQGLTPRDSDFERLIEAVREAERESKGTTVYLAGVDFSHVGPRFGDPPTDERVKQETEAKDRAAITAALAGDADAWFQAIASHDDSTRMCGFAPTYALLRCADVKDGRLLHYAQSDEPDTSFVSVATLAW
jgi:AmmeMemoRadiSam system protein B